MFAATLSVALMATASAQAVAFVNVTLVPMDRERVERGRTVVVEGTRIVAIGATGEVSIPQGSTVIDGSGRYLAPGLTDAHVHLTTGMPWALTRPDFGDAPIYLAYGVTTVVNLAGSPMQLEWRRRIETGELLGPTIYTSGAFVNEPRVATPDDVRRDIMAQARDGYDLIKFHELDRTTTGLSRAAYAAMIETAREQGLPLVGHAPVNLGVDTWLQARQSVAHVGMLSNIYFFPLSGNARLLTATATALFVLLLTAVMRGVAARVGRWVLLAGVLAFVSGASFLPGGPLFDSLALRVAFTALAIIIAAAAVVLVVLSARTWRDSRASSLARVQGAVVTIASLTLACTLMIVWVPVAWRSSDSGIARLAKRVHEAGISVQSTLVVYETFSAAGTAALMDDPAVNVLRAETRDGWRTLPRSGVPFSRLGGFMQKVTAALHREGVPIVAGTDAMGIALVAPGSSLHRELALLMKSGLTPYEAMRAATVAPAVFLMKAGEFGTIAVGRRADLLLVGENPLQNLATLKQPIGVMVRGRWLTRERLQQLLASLAE